MAAQVYERSLDKKTRHLRLLSYLLVKQNKAEEGPGHRPLQREKRNQFRCDVSTSRVASRKRCAKVIPDVIITWFLQSSNMTMFNTVDSI